MKKSYKRQFKTDLCEQVISGKLGHNEAAELHGISPIMLYRWISEYKTKGDLAFCGRGSMEAIYGEIDRLRAENTRLKKENEYLSGQNADYWMQLTYFWSKENK